MPDRHEERAILPGGIELGLEHLDGALRRLDRHLEIQVDAVHVLRPVIQSPARGQFHQFPGRGTQQIRNIISHQ
ncbi:hypothetical protein D3C81_1770330 [compost metagenome]